MSNVATMPSEDFVAASTNGTAVKIPRELFEALVEWDKAKKTGSIEIEYKCGGIAGIKAQLRLK